MYFIDFHTHVYPDAIAPKAADSIRRFYRLGDDYMDGRVQTLLKYGTEAGVEKFVILPVSLRPTNTRHINAFIIGEVAKQPRFFGYGTIHAGMQDLCEEVEYIMDHGLLGIKMHTDCQVFPIDDPRLFPVYDMVQDKLPILVHMGDQRYDFSHPARLRKVLAQFPDLNVIAAHFGGYSMFETARENLEDTDCVFDISSAMMFMQPGEAEGYINRYGAERMAYGTDYPLWDPVTEVQRFRRLKLTGEQFDQISYKTAQRILNL